MTDQTALATLARHQALLAHAEAQEARLPELTGDEWDEAAREAIAARCAALRLERDA